MTDTENLHFKIGVSGTYWDKKPQYSILINDEKIVEGSIRSASGVTEFVEFDKQVAEGTCSLKIRLENKDNSDTVENEDKTAIVKDMMLSIKSLEIDEIDVGYALYEKSLFTGDDPDRPVLDCCVDLGWNGTYELKFESPFFIWVLENI